MTDLMTTMARDLIRWHSAVPEVVIIGETSTALGNILGDRFLRRVGGSGREHDGGMAGLLFETWSESIKELLGTEQLSTVCQ